MSKSLLPAYKMRSNAEQARQECSFSSRDLSRLSGLTPRQVQWWCEHKILLSSKGICRRGAKVGPRIFNRRFSPSEVLLAMVLSAFKRKGLHLYHLRSIVKPLRDFIKFQVELSDPSAPGCLELFILSNGRHFDWATSATLGTTLHSFRGALCIVSLTALYRTLHELPHPS